MEDLPPHLLNWEPMEPEHLSLQVALLTMELAALRPRLAALEMATEQGLTGLRESLAALHERNS
jgi:hypothetical protein